MNVKKVYILILLILSYLVLLSLKFIDEDDRRVVHIKSTLEKFNLKYPRQKVYLHINKLSYTAGENIWFKAYVLNAVTHMPDTISTNLYVELINSGKRISQIKRIRLINGFGSGNFFLRDTVPEGLYQIRSYTNWMKNFSTEYYFTHNLDVRNPDFRKLISKKEANINKRIIKRTRKKSKSFDIQFFPEGGYLVYGIESVVGFKAINGAGKSVNVQGDIYDSDKNKITSFSSYHNGMGTFSVKPDYNKKYYAIVGSGQGKDIKINLPEPLKTGVVITVDNSDDDYVLVELKSNRPKTNDRLANEVVLIGQARGRILYSSVINLAGSHRSAKIEKKILPSGVIHLTVFANRYVPLAERLIFINHEDELDINIKTEHIKSETNDSLRLFIDVSDAIGSPQRSNLSLSVLNENESAADNANGSILSYLLLSSDLHGYIENPDYYFKNDDAKTIKALDCLMLTQGWRRFDWNELISDKYPEIKYLPEKYITIGGQITGEIFKRPLKDCNVRLTILDAYNDEFLQITGEKGYFRFSNMIYYDTVNIKIEARRPNNRKNILIVLHGEEHEEILNYHGDNLLTTVSERDMKSYRKEKYIELRKEEIEKEKREKERNKNVGIYGTPDYVITSDEIPSGYGNALQVIQGRVPGVRVTGNSVNIRHATSFMLSTEPLYVIDGIPVEDVSSVLAIPVEDIDRIEILKGARASIYGSRGANGVIAIYTKRGFFIKRGVIELQILGYSTPKKYYQPKYEIYDTSEAETVKPSSVYWEPFIQTNLSGQSIINFSIPGNSKIYRIIIEGISYKGHTGSSNLILETDQ